MAKTRQKPDKPHKDFPLGPASNGQWCKKIRGRIHYFGVWSEPDAAEAEYLRQKEYLQGGRLPPRKEQTGVTIMVLCNRFLNSKRALRDTGELSPRTFIDYHAACGEMLAHFGRERLVEDCGPDDFETYRVKVSKGCGLHHIAKRVTQVKSLFTFAYANKMIQKPVDFGLQCSRPSLKSMRIHRARKQEKHGLRMLEAAEIRQLLESAKPQLKAMILLACNGALGNTDCANLPQSAIKGDWLVYPRVKTGVDRRIPLWHETRQALTEAIATRPRAKDPADAGLCFLTRQGKRWVRFGANGTSIVDLISDAFSKALTKLKLKREGLGFYALRHGFETIAGGCGDQVATSAIMGHTDDSMSGLYREKIDDERLLTAVNHVRAWLFPKPAKKKPAKKAAKKAAKKQASK